jgi:RimJ/RimL family protein N-acetyltransferase
VSLTTDKVVLRPVSNEDLETLYRWRNSESYRALFVNRRNVVSVEEFRVEYKKEVERQRHIQFMVVLVRTAEPIGIIYSYGANMNDGFVFMGTYIDDRYQRRGYGAIASILFIKHMFDVYPLQKICVDIFSYNSPSLDGCKGLGFVKEGEFVRQRFYFGKYWNVVRMALFREDTERIQTLFRRLTTLDKKVPGQ